MQVRTKLITSHAIVATVLTIVAAVIIAILRIGDANQRELLSSYEQVRTINLIAAWSNDYSEQVAELFILDDDEAQIEEAREGLLATLDRKEELVTQELDQLADASEIARERMELVRIEDMRVLVGELDRVRARVSSLLSEGRREAAEQVYQDEIEHRFDSVLGALIDVATENEREEVVQAIERTDVLSDRMRLLAYGLVGMASLLLLTNALMVHHAVSRPVAALAAGAEAVGRGDLSHVVAIRRNDEFGGLAERFNVMTTQIREQRDSLQQAKLQLERQVAERTRELRARGEELEKAVVRLREIDTNRAQFFADVSHELRTPLTILRGHAEVTLRSPDSTPEQLRRALLQVVRKADHMGRLVDDLLFLARSEAGVISVERVSVDLQEVFADVLLDSQSLSRRAGVTISPRQRSEPVVIEGDADRLRQAILIPLDNAIRVAPAGTAVRLELHAKDGWASVTVTDDGPGFTIEEARRAFVRFFRGEGGRGRSGRGTGLGLAIARWIVDQHGGRISIESEPGKGATVRIDLPLHGAGV